MKTKLLFITLISVFCITTLSAQKKDKVTITGTVMDASRKPVANAMVMIDNVKTNAVTDVNGKYKVKVKADAVRIGILAFGHGLKEEDILGRTQIDFVFGGGKVDVSADQNIPDGETSASVGYSNIKKKNVTSDEYIKDPNDKKKTYSSIYDMLQEIPGLSVSGTTVNVRGASNLLGPIPPLYVIDGVYANDPTNVAPTQVEHITVLRGASATMYGSRGYGGVIVIKTKKIKVDNK